MTDPKMPEPVAYVDDLSRPQPHCVTSLKYCSVLQHQRGDHLRYIPIITTAAAQAYAAALAAARVAQERERCAQVCEGIGDSNKWSDAHACADAIRQQPPETGKEDNLALDRRPICSADGCSRREPCGFACRDNGNFSNCPAKPPETGKEPNHDHPRP